MEAFDEIIKEFENVVGKLDAWFMYYKDEGLFNSPFGVEHSIEDGLEKQIKSLHTDATMLKAAKMIIMLNAEAKNLKSI